MNRRRLVDMHNKPSKDNKVDQGNILKRIKRQLFPSRTPNPDSPSGASSASLPTPSGLLSPPAHDQQRPVSAHCEYTNNIYAQSGAGASRLSLPAPKLAAPEAGLTIICATRNAPPTTDPTPPPETKDELEVSAGAPRLAEADTVKDSNSVIADKPINSLWRKLIEKLPSEEAKEIQQLISNWDSTSRVSANKLKAPDSGVLEVLLDIAQRKRQESEEKRWGFQIVNGKKVILRAMLEKVIDFAKKFREIGSIAMQYDPGHAALPWAGFALILQFAISDQEILAHILSGLESIARILADNAFYEGLYLCPNSQSLFSDSTLPRFRKSLEDLHESIISYLVNTILITHQSTIKKFMTAPWKEGELSASMADVIRREGSLKGVVTLLETEANNNRNKRMMNQLKEVVLKWLNYKLRLELESKLSFVLHRRTLRYDEKLNGMLESIEGKKRRKILTWLSVIDYPNHHALAQKGRAEGTGQWILNHEEFLRWQESSGSACLWIKGNAGTGKTKLATLVIQNLIDDRKTSINSEGFAYFYCNRDDPERRKPAVVFSTLAKQMASLKPDGPLHGIVIKEYTHRELNTGNPSPLNFEDGQNLLKKLCSTYPRSWILIDALDECDSGTRYELVHALQDLTENSSSLLKVFITSRFDEDIAAVLNSKCIPTIILESTRAGSDIKKIAESQVNEAIDKRGLLSGKLKPEQLTGFKLEMTRILTEGAQGMPLWITYQIEAVCRPNQTKFQTPEQVLRALKAFPTGLTNTYNYILQDVLRKSEDECNAVAIAAFQWVMAAARPMKPNELLGAIGVHSGVGKLKSDFHANLTLETVIELCKHLLVHDESGGVIRFYHLSVREYLESCDGAFNMEVVRSLLIEPGLLLLAQVDQWDEEGKCFKSTTVDINHSQTTAFLHYTAWNLSAHVTEDTESEGMIKLLHNQVALREWFLSCIHSDYSDRNENNDQIFFYPQHAGEIFGSYQELATTAGALLQLQIVICFGLYKLLKILVDNRGLPKEPILLEIAALQGNKTIVKFLVENGNDPTNPGAVTKAAKKGHERIVRYLVENGAKADNPNAVKAAALFGHEQIVRYLVENGAKADNPDAVKYAAGRGHEQIVRYLVENGAKADGPYAVVFAAMNGHEQIVRYLVENGAKADNPDAVKYAAGRGHEQIVRYLVENGAKADNTYAVKYAAMNGHEQVVRYLVENGATMVQDESAMD